LAPLEGATVDGNRITAVEGGEILTIADILDRQGEVLGLRVAVSDEPADGSLRTRNGTTATPSLPPLKHDEDADTFTDAEGKVFRADAERGSFVADDGQALTPGWRVFVGVDNFMQMFTDSRISTLFASALVWTFAFAILSVATTFALGLF